MMIAILLSLRSILRARGGSSKKQFGGHVVYVYSPRTRR